MRSTLTTIILIGMLLGIAVGYAVHTLWPDPATAKTIASYISLMTDIFLRLIKMIIAPLVFSTLVVGVAHMGDPKIVGRIGAKAMVWFISASLVSLLLAWGRYGPLYPLFYQLPFAETIRNPIKFLNGFHLAWLIQPELFTGRDCAVAIDLGPGPSRGRTVMDRWGVTRGPRHNTVLETLDADGFFDLLGERLATLP